MEDEHCAMAGSDEEFVTGNYGVRTTPRKEYRIATGAEECPEEDKRDKKGRPVREVKSIRQLETLDVVKEAGLEEIEIIAVVRLYF